VQVDKDALIASGLDWTLAEAIPDLSEALTRALGKGKKHTGMIQDLNDLAVLGHDTVIGNGFDDIKF
jgi:hypothetical protein